jgi:hypothetical protein
MKTAIPQIDAKINMEVKIIPVSAPEDNVIDFEDAAEGLEGVTPAVRRVVLGRELEIVTALPAEEVAAGSATTLAVHAKAAPASLWSVGGPSVLLLIVWIPATTFGGKDPLMEEIVNRFE